MLTNQCRLDISNFRSSNCEDGTSFTVHNQGYCDPVTLPKVTHQPSSVTAKQGSAIRMSCRGTGTGISVMKRIRKPTLPTPHCKFQPLSSYNPEKSILIIDDPHIFQIQWYKGSVPTGVFGTEFLIKQSLAADAGRSVKQG